jgi:hypothetical protein
MTKVKCRDLLNGKDLLWARLDTLVQRGKSVPKGNKSRRQSLPFAMAQDLHSVYFSIRHQPYRRTATKLQSHPGFFD